MQVDTRTQTRVRTHVHAHMRVGKQNSLSAMERDFEETTESIAGVISPYMPGEVNLELERLNAQIDSQWRSGVQAAEEELRAGVERARYNIQRRTKRRVVEDGAARLTWRDGAIYATSVDGAVSVPILDSMGPAMYIDDIDDVHIFMGMQQGQDLAQHVVALGSLPVSARRWLACARQKLWWMSPDVGDRCTPIPAETQFLLYDAGGGMYAVILPLVGNTFRSALWGAAGREGGIDLHIESGDPNVKTDTCATSVVVAAGRHPLPLLDWSMPLSVSATCLTNLHQPCTKICPAYFAPISADLMPTVYRSYQAATRRRHGPLYAAGARLCSGRRPSWVLSSAQGESPPRLIGRLWLVHLGRLLLPGL